MPLALAHAAHAALGADGTSSGCVVEAGLLLTD